MRIALSGKMASGKSLVAKRLVERYGFVEISFASKLKEVVAELFPHSRYEKDRWLLQQVGERLREIDPRVWMRHLLKEIDDRDLVVSDMRYPNEYETLKRAHFVMIRMEADYKSRVAYIKKAYPDMPLVLMEDPSEVALDDYKFDYIVNNDVRVPMPKVYKQVDEIIKRLKEVRHDIR